jgi:hypothetical protein
MNRYYPAVALMAVTFGSTGCLVKDTTHRLYLSPSGAVTWTVLEEGVRSDDTDVRRRATEEQVWLDAIATDTHLVVEGLRRLGADEVSTRMLRSQRPYAAMTEAHFARVDRVIQRLFEELGIRGQATLDARGPEATLSVSIDLSSLDDPGPDTDSPVTALLEDLDRYRFTLTDGRFVSATGFDIVEDGAAATLQAISEETVDAGGVLTLRLVWRATRP